MHRLKPGVFWFNRPWLLLPVIKYLVRILHHNPMISEVTIKGLIGSQYRACHIILHDSTTVHCDIWAQVFREICAAAVCQLELENFSVHLQVFFNTFVFANSIFFASQFGKHSCFFSRTGFQGYVPLSWWVSYLPYGPQVARYIFRDCGRRFPCPSPMPHMQ